MYECFSEAVAWRLDEATNLPGLDLWMSGWYVSRVRVIRKIISLYYQTLVSRGFRRVEALLALRSKF